MAAGNGSLPPDTASTARIGERPRPRCNPPSQPELCDAPLQVGEPSIPDPERQGSCHDKKDILTSIHEPLEEKILSSVKTGQHISNHGSLPSVFVPFVAFMTVIHINYFAAKVPSNF